MLAPVTHILPLTSIRRTRMLPAPGQVTVRQNADVNATDVVALTNLPAEHMVLDIRRGLGIANSAEADRCIVRQPGDVLQKGDTIAETGGMFARLVRAPVAGEVVSVGGGQVMLRTGLRRVEVRAGFNGKVSEVLPEMGVVIETSGALIQGVWGNGQVDSGMLLAVARTPDEELTRPSIDVSMRGAVVLAGHCSNADALRVGAELPLRGLILASMTADLAPLARSLPYPIFVLEGFGKIPMNETAYTLLTTNEKREVSINTVYDPAAGERPEVIIPLDAVGHTSPETIEFAAGQKVRVQGWPYTGRVGTINLVLNGLTALPNGLRVPAADVQLDPETKITVPLANLEVLV